MAQYGTAPRKINGVWVTRAGRRLSPAGQQYWERKRQIGFVDETGHVNPAAVEASPHVPGLVQKGNIDITARQKVHAPTPGMPGYHSSVRSMSVDARDGSGSALIPTVIQKNGKWQVVSNNEAIAHYHKTGQHLGIFKTYQQADRYSQQLHEEQAAAGSQAPKLTRPTAPPQKPPPVGFDIGQVGHGKDTPQRQRQQRIYQRSQQAGKEAAQTREQLAAAKGYDQPAFHKAYTYVNPVVDKTLTALSPLTAARETVKAAKKGRPLAAGVAALGIVPFGPGGPEKAGAEIAKEGFFAHPWEIPAAAKKAKRALYEGEAVARPAVGPPTLEQHVGEAFSGSGSTYQAEKAIQSEQRAARVKQSSRAFASGGGGEEGHIAAKRALAGQYERLPFNDLANIDQPRMDRLINTVYDHPELQHFEAVKLADALRAAQHGTVPRPHEVRLAEKVFGARAAAEFAAPKASVVPGAAKQSFFAHPWEATSNAEADQSSRPRIFADQQASLEAKRALPAPAAQAPAPPYLSLAQQEEAKVPRLAHAISNIVNIPRSLMATGEFSYRMRNGLVYLAMDPKQALKNTGHSIVHHTFSQAGYEADMAALHANPEIQRAIENGWLSSTETGKFIPRREEAFASVFAEKGRYNPVRAAGRQYTGNAMLDRGSAYLSILDQAPKNKSLILRRPKGYTVTDSLRKDAGALADWSTGRMGWGHPTLEMLTNTFLFSPKLFRSRLHALNILPGKHGFYFNPNIHPFVRKKAALAMVKLVATGIGVLTLAAKYGLDVELDPRSSDFGKIRSGKTRFDPWGGHQQIVRTIAQIATQHTKSSTTGEIHRVKGPIAPIGQLLEGKLSPPFSTALDLQRGEMFGGQKLTWKAEALQHLSPLLYQDIWDAWHQMGAGTTAAVAGLGTFGVGTQTYSSQKAGKPQYTFDVHPNTRHRHPKTQQFQTSKKDPLLPSWAPNNKKPPPRGKDPLLPSWAR